MAGSFFIFYLHECLLCPNSQNTSLYISPKLSSNDRRGCVCVCLKSVQPLSELSTHQTPFLSLLFPCPLGTFMMSATHCCRPVDEHGEDKSPF